MNGEQGVVLPYIFILVGFQALMYLDQSEYLPWIDTAAMLVFITNISDVVYSQSVRYNAAPNQLTEIQIENVGSFI